MATPDMHLYVEDARIRLSHGPKENFARPTVNPLFRSIALARGADVIGVVLTGHPDDGTAGLQAIKQHGGIAIVQDPLEAEAPGMPRKAILEEMAARADVAQDPRRDELLAEAQHLNAHAALLRGLVDKTPAVSLA